MSQTKISVHPQIKKIIGNLDLDLGLELSRYEHSYLHDSALIPQLSSQDEPFYASTSNPFLADESALIEKEKLEDEVISVASHLVNEHTSILDRILTPWGIFGIIIFFAANLFIFVNLDHKTASELLNNNQDNSNTNNNQTRANTVNSETNSPREKIVAKDNKNTTSLQKPEKPPLAKTLPEVKEISNLNTSSPYPDLKTALFTEIKKQKATLPTQQTLSQSTTPLTSQSKNDTPAPTKYYVISNYKNMNEFTRIKEIVPSAFIINIDKQMKIQLAVFENEKEAKKKAQQLQNKGIDNYLYRNEG